MNLEIYQSIRSFILRKSMKMEKRKYLEKHFGSYIENGFAKKSHRNDPPSLPGLELEKRGAFLHYDGLQEYVKENTKVETLPFDKLDHLFRIHLAIAVALLFVNLAHCYVKTIRIRCIRNRLLRIKRKLAAGIASLAAFFRKLCTIFKLK